MALSEIYFVLTYLTDFTGEDEAEVMDNSRSDLRVSFPAATGVEVTTQNTTLCVGLYNQDFFSMLIPTVFLDKVVSQSNKCVHRKKRTSIQ